MDLETGYQKSPDTIISIFLNTTVYIYFQFPKREYWSLRMSMIPHRSSISLAKLTQEVFGSLEQTSLPLLYWNTTARQNFWTEPHNLFKVTEVTFKKNQTTTTTKKTTQHQHNNNKKTPPMKQTNKKIHLHDIILPDPKDHLEKQNGREQRTLGPGTWGDLSAARWRICGINKQGRLWCPHTWAGHKPFSVSSPALSPLQDHCDLSHGPGQLLPRARSAALHRQQGGACLTF